MKVSLVMATFDRAKQLEFSLSSISRQVIPWDFEVVVVNDGKEDGSRDVCEKYRGQLNINYVFSGVRNTNELVIRNPSIPNNIAVKQSTGDIIILSCPEIYHIGNVIKILVSPVLSRQLVMCVPSKMYWDNSSLLNSLPTDSPDLSKCQLYSSEKTKFPYLMAMWKYHFMSIGGYDEDFTGYGSEDDDLIRRLKRNKLKHYFVKCSAVHLWHASARSRPDWDAGRAYNRNLLSKKRSIVRNVGREWGVI